VLLLKKTDGPFFQEQPPKTNKKQPSVATLSPVQESCHNSDEHADFDVEEVDPFVRSPIDSDRNGHTMRRPICTGGIWPWRELESVEGVTDKNKKIMDKDHGDRYKSVGNGC